MTEEDARDWLASRFDAVRVERLAAFVASVASESERQNLVSASTLPSIWARHIVDSAQLLSRAPGDGIWLDVGTGAGFPGMVVAILRDAPTILVEPRKRRAAFLAEAAKALGLRSITVEQRRIEMVDAVDAAVLSARAVARPADLLLAARAHVGGSTVALLPGGRSIRDELARVRAIWHGMFHVEPSVTDADAGILVGRSMRPR